MSAVELDDADVALILEALEDAAVYRDARYRVLDMAVRRQARRGSAPAATGGGIEAHHDKTAAYPAPARPLMGGRRTQRAPLRLTPAKATLQTPRGGPRPSALPPVLVGLR